MGLLDVITSALGKGTKGLQEQALKSMLENVLGKDSPVISGLLKNIDMAKAGELVDFFKKNGIPDTPEEIKELIDKFTKSSKPTEKKQTKK